jgi:hypothetical protein
MPERLPGALPEGEAPYERDIEAAIAAVPGMRKVFDQANAEPNPDRRIFGILANAHSNATFLLESIRTKPGEVPLFLTHQDAMVAFGEELVRRVPASHLFFATESIEGDSIRSASTPEQIDGLIQAYQSNLLSVAGLRTADAPGFLDEIFAVSADEEGGLAESVYQLMSGLYRIQGLLLARGMDFGGDRPLDYEEREEARLNELIRQSLREARRVHGDQLSLEGLMPQMARALRERTREDFLERHEHISTMMASKVQPGRVGIAVMGARHTSASPEPGTADILLEQYLLKIPNSRVITVMPPLGFDVREPTAEEAVSTVLLRYIRSLS